MSTVMPIVANSSKKKNKPKNSYTHAKGSITKRLKASKNNGSNCSLHASELNDLEPLSKRFSIFKDQHLVRKFLGVPMSNNQKGRIRQVMKESLSGTSDLLLPDIINVKIQALISNNANISDTDLRKVRILYNMLRSAIARNEAKKQLDEIMVKMNEEEMKPKFKKKLDAKKKNVNEYGDTEKKEVKIIKHIENKNKQKSDDKLFKTKMDINNIKQLDSKINKLKHEEAKSKTKADESFSSKIEEDKDIKIKNQKHESNDPERVQCPKARNVKKKDKVKRYVVFVGNLPRDITKEKLMGHFREISPLIKHIRIPKIRNEAKRPYAYIELENEPSYEMALCKHHTMLGTRRINVLYSAQQKSNMTMGEAKSKSAKLQALIKSGKLVGSVPIEKKRSFRRKKKKMAEQAAEKQAKKAL